MMTRKNDTSDISNRTLLQLRMMEQASLCNKTHLTEVNALEKGATMHTLLKLIPLP